MARGGRIKKTFNFNKLSKKLANNVSTSINELGKQINIQIGKGLASGTDIKKKSFDRISPDSTEIIRARRGQGTKPLVISGNMEKRKIKKATPTKPIFTIEMTGKSERTGFRYGSIQNKGYTTSSRSAIPSKKVPARNWWGVPDSCRRGGSEWKKVVARVHLLNKIAWKK